MAIQLHSSIAVHPGPWLKRNVVDHYGLTVALVAEKLHVTRPAMSHLLNRKADLSPETAIRFEKGIGIPADRMLRMQTAFDMDDARAHADEIEVERLVA